MRSDYIENVSFRDAAVYIDLVCASSIVSSVMTSLHSLLNMVYYYLDNKGCITQREYTTRYHSHYHY